MSSFCIWFSLRWFWSLKGAFIVICSLLCLWFLAPRIKVERVWLSFFLVEVKCGGLLLITTDWSFVFIVIVTYYWLFGFCNVIPATCCCSCSYSRLDGVALRRTSCLDMLDRVGGCPSGCVIRLCHSSHLHELVLISLSWPRSNHTAESLHWPPSWMVIWIRVKPILRLIIKVELVWVVLSIVVFIAPVFIDERVFRLLLRVQVTEAYIVNAEFKVLTMLHDSHRVVHDVEWVCESTLELLLVSNHDSVSHDTPSSTQLWWHHFDRCQLAIKR